MTDDADTARQLDVFLAQVERRAFRIAEIATCNPDEALDIVQDAMLKLVQKYARRQPDEWPPLFYRILNNRINDWHRRGKVSRGWLSWWGDWKMRDDEGGLAEPEFAGNAADDPMQQLTQSDAMQDLVDVLGELPQRQQQAFMLRIWEGLDVAQTAFAMGLMNLTTKVFRQSADVLIDNAKQGDAQAEYELGLCYESGAWDVNQDNKQALVWIAKAAEDGNHLAMKTLAGIYLHGDLGLSADPAAAAEWEKRQRRIVGVTRSGSGCGQPRGVTRSVN